MTPYRKKVEFNCQMCGTKSVGTASSRYCIECKDIKITEGQRKNLDRLIARKANV